MLLPITREAQAHKWLSLGPAEIKDGSESKFHPAGEEHQGEVGRNEPYSPLHTLFSFTLIESVTVFAFRCIGNVTIGAFLRIELDNADLKGHICLICFLRKGEVYLFDKVIAVLE
ncbi:hypothetical protein HAX54_050562 [Datura stramonium]|uniref:Uncharacterized protein n=1 Tax=Datura stramonium TaxID=4076 RepID=A0ABS8SX98_DATST|nr:hypothetical protein [Datura stramonium]